jgi:hypothetical protein
VKLFARAWVYAIWAGLVVAALAITVRADPYIFALTCFAAAALSGVMAIVAVPVAVLGKHLSRTARAGIIGSMLVTGAALVVAFAHLGTFNWAQGPQVTPTTRAA